MRNFIGNIIFEFRKNTKSLSTLVTDTQNLLHRASGGPQMNQPQAGAKMLLVSGSRTVCWRGDSATNVRLAGKARATNITRPTPMAVKGVAGKGVFRRSLTRLRMLPFDVQDLTMEL